MGEATTKPGRRTGRIDWRAVADGAVITVSLTLFPTIAVRLFKDGDLDGQESNLWMIPLLALLVGSAWGGHRAAKRRLDAPLTHAALAAASAATVMAAVRIGRAVVTGDGFTGALVVTFVLLVQISVSLAIIGGFIAVRGETRRRAMADAGAQATQGSPSPDDEG